jgi:hypothetical protein
MERERKIITSILFLLMLLWLGFFLHRSPRFAGSTFGGVLGVSAALLMLVPLAYTICKRVSWIKSLCNTHLSLVKFLTWHIYTSLMGSFLAILHTGHRFDSWLGIFLTASMLLSILSGFICRHFYQYASQEQKENEVMLAKLRTEYDHMSDTNLSSRHMPAQTETQILNQIIEAMANTEFSAEAYGTLKRQLNIWLKVHIWLSVIFYLLLVLHIVAGVQYGLRWFL